MKQILTILLLFLITSCGDQGSQKDKQAPVPQYVETVRIIKSKKEAINTRYRYKYNVWRGKFYHVPDIQNVYYFGYTDGSIEQVNLDEYMFHEPGDTIRKTTIKY